MKAFAWIFKSFTADKDGGSARKLSAFYAVVLMAGFVTIKKTDASNARDILFIWLGFAALCLGMVTVQQLVEFKNGSIKSTSKTTSTESITEVTPKKNDDESQ